MKTRALVCHALRDDYSGLRLEERELSAPGPRQVILQVNAASVNFPDLLMTQGKYQYRPDPPFIPGMEAAGIVLAAGAESGFVVGQRALGHAKTGAFAQAMLLEAEQVRAIPQGLDDAQAAAFQAAAVTAWVSLALRGQLQRGETLLVHGATGGVGMAAVQLGLHLGARVIATGSSDEKLAVVAAQGEVTTLSAHPGFREQVKALTGGRGADVIFDPVGGDVFDESTRCIAWGGRLLVVGFASGRIPSISVNMPLIKGFSVVGVRAGEYGRRNPAAGAENIRTIDRLASEGVFRPHICARFGLSEAVTAMKQLAERKVVGKVIIEPGRG